MGFWFYAGAKPKLGHDRHSNLFCKPRWFQSPAVKAARNCSTIIIFGAEGLSDTECRSLLPRQIGLQTNIMRIRH